MAPEIYLAGFDVFRTDAVEHGAALKSLCAAQGMHGLYPMDNQIPEGLAGGAAAQAIYRQNVQMIRRCDAVLANLDTFRGQEPDSGTAFEIGMAVALGKPVWAYFTPVADLRTLVGCGPQGLDASGFCVEDFGLPRNLMLACSWVGYSATVEAGVAALARYLGSR